MKTILYFIFFHPNVLFSDSKHLCSGDEFTHSIFCEQYSTNCSVSFYSTDGFNRLDPIYDGDIRLPLIKWVKFLKWNLTSLMHKIKSGYPIVW
jgi:hypothetical protein